MPNIKLEGTVEWAKVHEPDTKFVKPHGEYSANIIMSEAEATVLCEQLEVLAKQKLEQTVKEAPENKRNALRASLSIATNNKEHYDRDGNPTGNMFFKTKLAAVRKKDGVDVRQRPMVLDAKKQPIDPSILIGNGSVVKAIIDPYPYYMPSSKTVGTSLRLVALQVIKLEEGRPTAMSLLDEEDGYVAEAVAKDNTQESSAMDMLDDNLPTGSSDEGDF
jgi:hypothetical protein